MSLSLCSALPAGDRHNHRWSYQSCPRAAEAPSSFGEAARMKKSASVDFFPIACRRSSLCFSSEASSREASGNASDAPHRELLARRGIHLGEQSRSKRAGRKAKVDDEQAIADDLSLSCASLFLLGGSLSFLFFSLEIQIYRDSERTSSIERERPTRRRSATRLGESPAATLRSPAAAGCSSIRERASLLFFPPFLFYVPAASLAALGPVDRVPCVLHHGERTRKESKKGNGELERRVVK